MSEKGNDKMADAELKQFEKHKYINIETYRKSGEAVKTPVWFVEDQGVLFVRTGAESGKVKRLKRNAQVKVVPCSMGGNPLGTWVGASAEVVSDMSESARIEGLLRKKYGIQKALFDFVGRTNKAETATIKIRILE
jgi:PPOX class probable F420-dependent enzyme